MLPRSEVRCNFTKQLISTAAVPPWGQDMLLPICWRRILNLLTSYCVHMQLQVTFTFETCSLNYGMMMLNIEGLFNATEQNSCTEAADRSVSQKIPCSLWNSSISTAYTRPHRSRCILFVWDPFERYPPINSQIAEVIRSIQIFRLKLCICFSSFPCLLHNPNNVSWNVQNNGAPHYEVLFY
jgi:hypothetical protein